MTSPSALADSHPAPVVTQYHDPTLDRQAVMGWRSAADERVAAAPNTPANWTSRRSVTLRHAKLTLYVAGIDKRLPE